MTTLGVTVKPVVKTPAKQERAERKNSFRENKKPQKETKVDVTESDED